jgi:hypothetical protein
MRHFMLAKTAPLQKGLPVDTRHFTREKLTVSSLLNSIE